MPIFKHCTVFEVARGKKAFLSFEVGVTRDEVPEPAAEGLKHSKPWQQAGRHSNINPANVIWIFGAGRTGSTWLANMMSEALRTSFWNEPMLGRLFGGFYDTAQVGQLNSRNFILGEPARKGWLPLLREFVLGNASYRYPRLGPKDYLVVKEPNGSVGAPLLMEALPESRMILLVRDPRDVVASVLDGARKGSWLYERKRGRRGEESLADTNPNALIEGTSKRYLRNVTGAKEAFEAHTGHKVLVRYEELRIDPSGTMRRILSTLEVPADEKRIARTVEKHSWENIPEENKGEGKIFRKATPRGWSDDLTPEQVKIVERITAPLLGEFYPEKQPERG